MKRTILRIGHEIQEAHYDSENLLILGVKKRGWQLAEQLIAHLKSLSPPFSLQSMSLEIKGEQGRHFSSASDIPTDWKGANILLIDDVLNTGITLAKSMSLLMQAKPKRLEIGILVDRNHKRFPIEAKYVGYQLNTTLEEFIHVDFGSGIYLS